MKKLFLLFLTCFTTVLFSQTVEEVDAASYKICNYLGTLDYIENDEIKMDILFRDPMDDALNAVPEADAEEFQKRIYYRLQRNCVDFQELLQRLEPHKDDARITSVKPISTISKKELKNFKKTEDFSYLEADGKRTKVKISDGFWQDYFEDNTYSKLTFSWIDENKFKLIFIESNNETRANLSIPGDAYLYEIIEKTKEYYVVSAEVEGQKVYQIFKLYY
ncbi:hypothetical protein K8089_10965 [Aequorivita sp. F47161]|uniref:Uncharacterized protein n=1 Tax=Aequorivita vitellina TaxID=2874475 RepID=A0A9X1QVK6_9FLAO|nr:hypothetical protein [Aequorivita vitellina]MCG2419545.1 hypothetical protein [Aequorivita vitellina]